MKIVMAQLKKLDDEGTVQTVGLCYGNNAEKEIKKMAEDKGYKDYYIVVWKAYGNAT